MAESLKESSVGLCCKEGNAGCRSDNRGDCDYVGCATGRVAAYQDAESDVHFWWMLLMHALMPRELVLAALSLFQYKLNQHVWHCCTSRACCNPLLLRQQATERNAAHTYAKPQVLLVAAWALRVPTCATCATVDSAPQDEIPENPETSQTHPKHSKRHSHDTH